MLIYFIHLDIMYISKDSLLAKLNIDYSQNNLINIFVIFMASYFNN
jgi:hypothetical protein